jgi:hypothetical protein
MAKLLSIFISLVFLATPAVAAKKKKKQNREWYFKVKKIQGQVLAIKPNSSWWRAIHVSQILPEGTLLSVQKGQTATIQIFSPDLGNKVAPVLNFDRWMTTRLDRYSLREVTKEKAYFQDRADLRNFTDGDAKKFNIGDAFKKYIAEAGFSDEVGDSVSKASQIKAQSIKPIQLLRPKIKHRVVAKELPIPFSVVWMPIKAKKKPEYLLKMWIKGEGEAEAEVITKKTMSTVEFNGYGEYFIKIVTADGRYASQAHNVEILRPTDIIEINGSKISLEENEIRLLSPPSKLDALTKDRLTNLEFQWEFSELYKPKGVKYNLIVLRRGILFKSKLVKESSTSVALPKGSFSWYVKTKISNPEYLIWKKGDRKLERPPRYLTAKSKKWRFRIQSNKSKLSKIEMIRLVAAGSGKTIYLSEGL